MPHDWQSMRLRAPIAGLDQYFAWLGFLATLASTATAMQRWQGARRASVDLFALFYIARNLILSNEAKKHVVDGLCRKRDFICRSSKKGRNSLRVLNSSIFEQDQRNIALQEFYS